MLTIFGVILTWLSISYFNVHVRDAPSRALGVMVRCPPLVSEGPVVGLIIEPPPGNRPPSLSPPGPTRNQRGGNTDHPDLSGRFIYWVWPIDRECTLRGGRSKMYTLALTR